MDHRVNSLRESLYKYALAGPSASADPQFVGLAGAMLVHRRHAVCLFVGLRNRGITLLPRGRSRSPTPASTEILHFNGNLALVATSPASDSAPPTYFIARFRPKYGVHA